MTLLTHIVVASTGSANATRGAQPPATKTPLQRKPRPEGQRHAILEAVAHLIARETDHLLCAYEALYQA